MKSRYPRKRLILYLIPILMGLGGIQFSLQLDSVALRGIVTLLSVAIPLISCGNLLARFQISLVERFFLLLGVIFLLVGAGLSVSGFTAVAADATYTSQQIAFYSRMIGIGSLMLGLVVVLYMVARTGEDIEGMAERFMYLANHMHEGFILSRVDGPVLMVNKRFLEMFRVDESEVLGRKTIELAERFQLDGVPEHIENRRNGIASEYEVTWAVDGEERYFWFSGTPVRNRFGRHYANLATVREITEQKRLAKRVERYAQGLQTLVEEQTLKLQESEERFRTLLLSMNEGFLTIDGGNRIQFVNRRICDLLKINEAAILGRDVLDFVDAAGRVRLLNLLVRRESLAGEDARLELNFVDAIGGAVPVMLAATYLSQGTAIEPVISLVVTGVSELKQMQLQLEQRAQKLEELNEELLMHDRAKDSFLSNVSHELRTPLSTIQGYVEMLESGSLGEMAGPQISAIRVMDRNVRRLVGHLNEIIEFSRMEIRGVQISRRLCTPSALIQEAVSSFHPSALARDIVLTSTVVDGLPPIWCDRTKMDQVLGILFNNALKFTPEGGSIIVTAGCIAGRTFTMSVTDTGIGIRREHHQKVFDKFFQVDSSKTRRYEGTGIGLSIAKSIVEAHGGTISLESEEGKGCTFTVKLPNAVFDPEWKLDSLSHLSGLDVLIVDEGEAFPRALDLVLGPLGIRSRRATNGFQCVRELEQKQPDLILLNDTVNDIAGLSTLTLLRQHLSADTVPVIAFTGATGERLREAGDLWGDIYFVSKPFAAQDFAEALHAVCNDDESGLEKGRPARDQNTDGVLAKILVVDNDPGLLEWVDTAMAHRHVLAYCAAAPAQALELLQIERPGLILVDVDVPGTSVFDQLEALLPYAEARGVPLYVMTGLPQRTRMPQGVAGCIRKPFSTEDLMDLVRKHAELVGQPVESAQSAVALR
jgi:PAS domain S-box-containing protein